MLQFDQIALLQIKNSDIDFDRGEIVLRKETTKEKKERRVPINIDDLNLLQYFMVGDKGQFYFRHVVLRSGVTFNQQFGRKYLLKFWHKARELAGVRYVDLYGGTRHSSISALSGLMTSEEVKKGSMHSTIAAFDRYYRVNADVNAAREVYCHTRKGILDSA